MEIKQVVIWGHKLHSHTHSYIHNGFFIAFNKKGFKTYYYDDNDDVRNHDFSHSLFITEHQVNKKIPLRQDCLYLTHYIDEGDYLGIPKENIIILKVTLRDFVEGDSNKNLNYIALPFGQKHEYHTLDNGFNCLYMYWATDLLPDEINANIRDMDHIKPEHEINFIGSVTQPWQHFYQICVRNGLRFNHFGASFNTNSNKNVTIKDNMILTKRSLIAPALQDDSQVKKQYIPCRIFKNISYGKMGITNNKTVNELFDNRLIYHTDLDILFKKGTEFENTPNKQEIVIELMKYVRDNHTYINRVNTILTYIKEYTKFTM
jgi:hypothetical protein